MMMAFSSAVLASEVIIFSSDQLRDRYYNLIDELRCPKCQNQNLSDSNSLIAVDLRNEIYLMLEDGRANDDIVDFLSSRYGDFVRYRPPLNMATLILWFTPGVLFLLGIIFIYLFRRRESAVSHAAVALNKNQQLYLNKLLAERPANSAPIDDGEKK
ncbi:MAG: cytochrome c-type biogenesis protein CcmH [Saprospiraceae bacterium]|jgi:cytochrome c-type biogenesis protein CcmH